MDPELTQDGDFFEGFKEVFAEKPAEYSKDKMRRLKIMDAMIGRGGCTKEQIMERLSGRDLKVSERSFRLYLDDLDDMGREKLGDRYPEEGIIIVNRKATKPTYCYFEAGFSVFEKLPLDVLDQFLAKLQNNTRYAASDEIEGLIDDIRVSISNIQGRFEVMTYAGNNYAAMFRKLAAYMRDEKVVEFYYTPYGSSHAHLHRVSPYLLERYDDMWYLIGMRTDYEPHALRNFGFDRIDASSIRDLGHDDFVPKPADLDKFYDDCIGFSNYDRRPSYPGQPISNFADANLAEEYVFEFRSGHFSYAEATAPHKSFRKLSVDAVRGAVTASMRVKWNYELDYWVLRHGSNICVLKPLWYRDYIRKMLQEAVGKY